jgi:hypothetical protein
VSKLITHQKMRAVLCQMTQQSDPDLACRAARRLLRLSEENTTRTTPSDGKARRSNPKVNTSASGRPRADARSSRACSVCRQPLPTRQVAQRLTMHPACRPVPCRGCRRAFHRTVLVNQRCPTCSQKPVTQDARKHKRKSMKKATRARRSTSHHEADRLPPLPRRSECPMCGNRGNHLCGRQWRLANGQIGKRPRGGSVWTVSGGLPGLGKRSP